MHMSDDDIGEDREGDGGDDFGDVQRHELRTFGRRRGRKLSPRQAALMSGLLPKLAVDLGSDSPPDARALFTAPVEDVWLEIGFGGAEHLLWQAREHPRVGVIGCEPFEEGVVKALAGIEAGSIEACGLDARVRLVADDARPLLRWLPDASIGRAFILFPDPWPKKRHAKRRLVQPALLAEMARVMRSGAELRIGTDIGDYARTVLLAMRQVPEFAWLANGPSDWRERPADWPPTRYEQKGIREGRRCAYLRFRRV